MESNDLKALLAFARELEKDSPATMGVQSLMLRRLLGQLASLSDIVEWISEGDQEMAKAEMVLRLDDATPLIRQLDQLLATPAAPPAKELINQAVSQRMGVILDRIITASVQRLPTDLQRHSVSARVIRSAHAQAGERWTQERGYLLDCVHGLRSVVADLAHAYYQRYDLATPQLTCERTLANVHLHIASLREAEVVLSRLNTELDNLYQQVLPLSQSGRHIIDELERLRAAMAILEVPIQDDIQEQMSQWLERLRTYLLSVNDDFAQLPTYERDPTFVDTLGEIEGLCERVSHLLNPIRPSVFSRPLERAEEVRRLALIALCLYTNRPDRFNPNKRKGIGKHTAPEVLMLADLIDQSEYEAAANNIFAFQTQSGESLAEKESRGLFWFYWVTDEGVVQADEWLNDTLDAKTLKNRINEAIAQRRDTTKKRKWVNQRKRD